MSLLAQRCDRARESVTLDMLFDVLGWDLPQRGRIRCIWPDHEDRTPAMQVYRDTNSVYCFACNKTGDVIEIVRQCVEPGEEWNVGQAVDWIEKTFALPPMRAGLGLQGRLRKQLALRKTPEPGASLQDRKVLEHIIAEAFANVEKNVPATQLTCAGTLKDYVWDELNDPFADPVEWATWARQIIYGSYARLLGTTLPDTPASVIDDRPQTVRRARAWEHHRGAEYLNPWPHVLLF